MLCHFLKIIVKNFITNILQNVITSGNNFNMPLLKRKNLISQYTQNRHKPSDLYSPNSAVSDFDLRWLEGWHFFILTIFFFIPPVWLLYCVVRWRQLRANAHITDGNTLFKCKFCICHDEETKRGTTGSAEGWGWRCKKRRTVTAKVLPPLLSFYIFPKRHHSICVWACISLCVWIVICPQGF